MAGKPKFILKTKYCYYVGGAVHRLPIKIVEQLLPKTLLKICAFAKIIISIGNNFLSSNSVFIKYTEFYSKLVAVIRRREDKRWIASDLTAPICVM